MASHESHENSASQAFCDVCSLSVMFCPIYRMLVMKGLINSIFGDSRLQIIKEIKSISLPTVSLQILTEN